VAGWLHTEISVRHRELNPDTVAHLNTNRARHRLTSLIEANALTTTPDHQESCGCEPGMVHKNSYSFRQILCGNREAVILAALGRRGRSMAEFMISQSCFHRLRLLFISVHIRNDNTTTVHYNSRLPASTVTASHRLLQSAETYEFSVLRTRSCLGDRVFVM